MKAYVSGCAFFSVVGLVDIWRDLTINGLWALTIIIGMAIAIVVASIFLPGFRESSRIIGIVTSIMSGTVIMYLMTGTMFIEAIDYIEMLTAPFFVLSVFWFLAGIGMAKARRVDDKSQDAA